MQQFNMYLEQNLNPYINSMEYHKLLSALEKKGFANFDIPVIVMGIDG